MPGTGSDLVQPIRVVVFGGGPVLERGVQRFLTRLEDHPEIDLLLVVCQADSQSKWPVVQDLWRRRGLLAVPLLLIQGLEDLGRWLRDRRTEARLRSALLALADRITFMPDIHAEEVLARVRACQPDLGLIYGSPILKPSLFEIPRFGTLGIHHGKLPEYRGKKTTFWAMYRGEPTAGVAIQRVNAGLDTGEIVVSGEVPIGKRSLSRVWAELEELGLCLYEEAILSIKNGTATYTPQPGKKGKLYKDPTLADILTFWHRRIRKVL